MFNKLKSLFSKKEPTIEFYSIVPGLEVINPPILAAQDALPAWVKNKSAANKESIKTLNEFNPNEGATHQFFIEKCPGIRSIMNEGIHLKTWQDIKITLLSNEEGQFKIDTPTPTSVLVNGHLINPEVQSHNGNQFPEFACGRSDTWPHILKILSNWRVSIDKDWQIMMLPVYYSNYSNLFSAVPGIFNPEFGNHLNINIQIHKRAPVSFIIPAGTSIVKLLPIKKKSDFNLKIRKVHPNDAVREQLTLAVLKKRYISQRKEQVDDIKKVNDVLKCPFFHNK